jgi:glycosyltransferase involved in cell wall biosynthesis
MKRKKALVYCEYYGINLGGSESYAAHIFKILDNGYDLYLYPGENIKKNDMVEYIEKFYGIVLTKNIKPAKFLNPDLFINVQRNNKPTLKKNAIHIVHFPQKPTQLKFRKNLLKLFYGLFCSFFYQYTYICYLCNSQFTAYYFKQYYPQIQQAKIKVLYPPVNLFESRTSILRRNQIVIFSRINPEKNIDCLINVFVSFFSNHSLIVMGAINDHKDEKYYSTLSRNISSKKINFIINPSRNKIEGILQESLIFWHAMGYQQEDPKYYEHFGITTVEAMSAGVIPIVIDKGGQSEIVDEGVNGFKWRTIEELKIKTDHVLHSTPEELSYISNNAVKKSQQYGKESFSSNFISILSNLGIQL